MAGPADGAQSGIAATRLNFCTVELLPAEAGNGIHPGGRMVITSHASPMLDADMPVLTDALHRILARRQPFEAVYDFRKYTRPSLDQVRRMARWCDQHQEAWDTLVEAAAIIIEAGMFSAITKGILDSFMRIFPPACPVLICHDQAAADDFLRRHIRPRVAGRSESFHSIVSFCAPFGHMDSFASIESLDESGSGDPLMLGCCTFVPLENGDLQVNQSVDGRGWSCFSRRAWLWKQGSRPSPASRTKSFADLHGDAGLCAAETRSLGLEKPGQVDLSLLSLRTPDFICSLDVQAMAQVALRAIADWLLFASKMCSPPEPIRSTPFPMVTAC